MPTTVCVQQDGLSRAPPSRQQFFASASWPADGNGDGRRHGHGEGGWSHARDRRDAGIQVNCLHACLFSFSFVSACKPGLKVIVESTISGAERFWCSRARGGDGKGIQMELLPRDEKAEVQDFRIRIPQRQTLADAVVMDRMTAATSMCRTQRDIHAICSDQLLTSVI
jgi:hypothetical protein